MAATGSLRIFTMLKLKIKVMEDWSLAERVAFYVREFHPEVFDEALDAMYKEDSQN